MITLRKIAAACLIAAFLLPSTSFAGDDKKEKKDNGKHKGWYKNPNNPHHPDHVSKHKKKHKHKGGDDDKAEKDDKYEAPKDIIITPKGKGDPKPTGPVLGKPGDGTGTKGDPKPTGPVLGKPGDGTGTKGDPKPTGPVIGTKPGVGKG